MAAVRTTRRPCRARGGFTLIETAMTTVIIGVGVVAMVEAQQSFMQANRWSSQAAQATFLANEIREMTRSMSRHDPVTGLFTTNENGAAVVRGWGPETGELLVTDYDDIDDFDARTFGQGGNMDGPINAFGEIIPEVRADGTPVLDEGGNPIPMRGWSQMVTVTKVDPFNFGTARATGFFELPSGTFLGRQVGDYPLRVTVSVTFRGEFDERAREITRLSWIVPASR